MILLRLLKLVAPRALRLARAEGYAEGRADAVSDFSDSALYGPFIAAAATAFAARQAYRLGVTHGLAQATLPPYLQDLSQ